MSVKMLLIGVLVAGMVWPSHAQQYLNLGLEYQRSPGVPAQWDVVNGTLQMEDRETGDWLCERFGSDYYVIGTCFNRGAYLAGNIYNDRYMNVYAFPGMPGSYEYMFGSMGKPRFFLNWRGVRQNNDNAWLFHPMLLRSTGSQWSLNEFYPVSLTERFDAVVFIEESEPITSYYRIDR